MGVYVLGLILVLRGKGLGGWGDVRQRDLGPVE